MTTEPTWAEVNAFIRANPDGAELGEIGELFGLTVERVRQIEASALRKMSRALGNAGHIARGATAINARREARIRAVSRLSGYADDEIAAMLSMDLATVRNTLRVLRARGERMQVRRSLGRLEVRVCMRCGESFTVPASQPTKCCSRSCGARLRWAR